jgi:tripartite-type tricarboxylate transporter receptor subunit TctC
MTGTRAAALVVALTLALAAAPVPARGAYSSRPITIVVPFPPGGIADLTARPLAAAFERVLKMRHLPTTGGGPATTAVLGGHAALWASPPALALPHIRSGKMRRLASFGAARLASMPDVPTLEECGLDIEYDLWAGLFAPRGVPPAVVTTLCDATRRAVEDPEFKAAADRAQRQIGKVETR